eukprot:COSAG03_NODE_6080_length_1119_cov_1.103922_2_plen_56_part_01
MIDALCFKKLSQQITPLHEDKPSVTVQLEVSSPLADRRDADTGNISTPPLPTRVAS